MMLRVKFIKMIGVLLVTAMVSGCATNKQGIGTGAGLLVGGLVGSQFGKGDGQIVATILGAGAGALIGGAIGQNLDEQDKRLMETSSQKALEVGQTGSSTAWKNPDNGHSGSITPVKTYQNDKGEYCREYTQIVEIGGKSEKAYGKACRKPDGQWRIVQH